MRIAKLILMVALVTILGLSAGAGPEKKWFDPKGCTICKNLDAENGLMENMRWETHKIENGMLSVAMIPAEYQEAFARAGKNMQKAAQSMTPDAPMCGFCANYGMLMMSGATVEEIHSEAGHINLMTATDPEVVEKIHAHADKTMAEYKKWMAGEAPYQRAAATN